MPYGKKKEQIRNLERKIKRMEEKILVQEFNKATEKIIKEAGKMYDKYLDYFYSYKTSSYIRHGETKPGTSIGINLYRGINIEKNEKSVKDIDQKYVEFKLNLNGNDMEGGYQHNTPDEVLDTVMNGVRGIPGIWSKKWSYTYDGDYYNSGEIEKMIDVFGDFMRKTGNIAYRIAMPNINEKMFPYYKEQAQELKKILYGK